MVNGNGISLYICMLAIAISCYQAKSIIYYRMHPINKIRLRLYKLADLSLKFLSSTRPVYIHKHTGNYFIRGLIKKLQHTYNVSIYKCN